MVFLQVYSQPLNGEPMWPFPVIPILVNGEYRMQYTIPVVSLIASDVSSLVGVTF